MVYSHGWTRACSATAVAAVYHLPFRNFADSNG